MYEHIYRRLLENTLTVLVGLKKKKKKAPGIVNLFFCVCMNIQNTSYSLIQLGAHKVILLHGTAPASKSSSKFLFLKQTVIEARAINYPEK